MVRDGLCLQVKLSRKRALIALEHVSFFVLSLLGFLTPLGARMHGCNLAYLPDYIIIYCKLLLLFLPSHSFYFTVAEKLFV